MRDAASAEDVGRMQGVCRRIERGIPERTAVFRLCGKVMVRGGEDFDQGTVREVGRRGMDRWVVGRISLPVRRVGYITVPCCPLCRQHVGFALEQVRADAGMRMDELEERLEG